MYAVCTGVSEYSNLFMSKSLALAFSTFAGAYTLQRCCVCLQSYASDSTKIRSGSESYMRPFAGQQHSIPICGVSADAVHMLVDYLYGGCQHQLTAAHAVSLFKISDMFGVTSLQLQCVEALRVLLTQHSLLHVERLAQRYHCSELSQVSLCRSCSSASLVMMFVTCYALVLS